MKSFLALLLFFSSALVLSAQQLQVDPAFATNGGASGTIFTVQAQPDNRILLAGDFVNYAGSASRSLVRIFPNGLRDTSFQVGSGANGRVNVMRLSGSGQVLIAGIFNQYNGQDSKNLARLHPNGQRDTTLQLGTSLNNEVLGMEVLSDQSILLSGFFSQYRGSAVTQPLKLLANGTRDTSFNQGGTGSFGLIEVIRQQPDGKILIAGSITQYNGQPVGRGIVRLHPNGSLDTSFQTGTGLASGLIRTMELQPDGKIVLGGSFSSFNGQSVQRLIRLHANGQLDTSFLINTPFNGTMVAMMVRRNGNIIGFASYPAGGTQLPYMWAEYSPQGVQITQPGTCVSANSAPQGVVELSDSSLIIGGGFTQAGGLNVSRVARLVSLSGTGVAGQPVITPSSTQIACSGSPVSMSVAGSLNGASQWAWYSGSCGNNLEAVGVSVQLSPQQTTTYYVRGEGACMASGPCDSVTIVVSDTLAPVPVVPSLPLLQAFCSLTVTAPTAIDNCDGTVLGTTTNPTTYNTTGTYQLLWTYTDASGNSSQQLQQVVIDSIDTRVQQQGQSLTAMANAATYQWLDCNAGLQAVAGATQQQFNAPGAGYWAVAVSLGGCTDTSACYQTLSTGVFHELWPGLRIYPNPAKHQVMVSFGQPLQWKLYDLQGRLVFEHHSLGGSENINLPALPAGMYLWHIQHQAELRYVRQLIE